MRPRAMILAAVLVASCAAPAPAVSSQPPATVAAPAATVPATSSAVPTAGFAAAECTTATTTTRQVIERYLSLSTSNNVQAVTDCFARSWRDKTATFADGAVQWSRSGPATNVVITFMDAVNGCDRFSVSAQMPSAPNSAFRVPPFFSVGAEAGRARIHETSTALTNASSTTLRCG